MQGYCYAVSKVFWMIWLKPKEYSMIFCFSNSLDFHLMSFWSFTKLKIHLSQIKAPLINYLINGPKGPCSQNLHPFQLSLLQNAQLGLVRGRTAGRQGLHQLNRAKQRSETP